MRPGGSQNVTPRGLQNLNHNAATAKSLSSCHYQKKEIGIFRVGPSTEYTGDDIFPDSPLFRVPEHCTLTRSLRSLVRELVVHDQPNEF